MDENSPLREGHGAIAAEEFAKWLQAEGMLSRLTEEQAADLAKAFMQGFAVGVGVGTTEGLLLRQLS